MQALLWVATFGFSIKYLVDKWALLNFYRKPPLYAVTPPFPISILDAPSISMGHLSVLITLRLAQVRMISSS